MRSGAITVKLGMTRLFDSAGNHIPVTVLRLDKNRVIAHKTMEKHGYKAVVIGSGEAKASRLSKPVRKFYEKSGSDVFSRMKEFRVEEHMAIGDSISVDHFTAGQAVDVTSVSIGKGFAGPMKRHNFAGNRASHGVSLSHRSHGSTGQCQDPGRVFKGKKMAGHLGAHRVTIQNLKIVEVDADRGLFYVKGAVPGHKGAVVYLRDSIKASNKKAS